MNSQRANVVRAFLHGMTGAGLFRRPDYPGAPAEFVDTRSLDEIRANGEFDLTCGIYNEAKFAKQRDDARQHTEAKAARVRTHR
jgi:hypothetical protein